MSEKLCCQTASHEVGSVITEDFERRLAEITPPELNEFNDTRQKLLDDIKSLSDDRDQVVRDMEVNKAMAPVVFKRVGGEQVFADKMTSLNEQEAVLRSQQEDLNDLYRRLGGEKVDALREQLIAETGGKTRATWKAEAIVTERALQRAQQEFADNYSAYQTESAEGGKDDDSAGSNEDGPKGLNQYDLMLQEKHLSDKFDEADRDIANAAEDDAEPEPEPEPKLKPEPVGTPPIEQPGKPDGELEKQIKDLEDQFADAKFAVETSLLKRFGGGKKKRQKLEEIEQKLREAYAKKWTAENGDFTNGAVEECAYNMIVALDDVDKKVADKLKDREDDRGRLRRAAAAIGGWFAKGKPRTFMSGMGVGIATSLVGVWPLTTVVGLGATLGVKFSAKEHALAERAKVGHVERTEDEQRRAAQKLVGSVETAANNNETEQDRRERVATALAGVALRGSVEGSLHKRDDLVKEVRKTAGVFGAGFLAGGLVGHAAQNLELFSSISDQAAEKAEAAASTGDHGSIMDGIRGVKDEMINQVQEAQTGAAKMDAVESMKEAMIAQAQEARDAIANAANINILPADFSNYDFPWDWAVEKFGEADAGLMLEKLSEIAANNGHEVQWFGDGVNRWVQVDGMSTTQDVLKVLSQYANQL